jgi:hypothetical protein
MASALFNTRQELARLLERPGLGGKCLILLNFHRKMDL